jgi:hypothetical protein
LKEYPMRALTTTTLVILLSALTSPVALAVAGDPKNGVLSGLSVTWTGPAATPDKLTIQRGEAYVDQQQFVAVGSTPLDASVAGSYANGVTETENQPYYVYLFWDTVALVFIEGLISDKAPTNDGIAPNTVKAHNGDVGFGVFLGSILIDSTKHVVPFIRTGDEVILNHVENFKNEVGGCSGRLRF